MRNSVAVLVALSAIPLSGQRPIDLRDKNNFRIGSELVTTAVTVRDADGRLVTHLEKGDFIVEEDGVVQPITQFTKERVPISLSLALDVSDSMRGVRMSRFAHRPRPLSGFSARRGR